MGALRVVVDPPCLDRVACLLQRHEPVAVEIFGAKVTIEGFSKGVVRGLTRWRAFELHPILAGLGI